MRWAFGAPILICAFLIILNSYRYPRASLSGKRFFLMGLIFPACSIFSPFAAFLCKGLHGLEYTFLSCGMVSKSQHKYSTRAIAAAAVIFAILLFMNFYAREAKFLEFSLFPRSYLAPMWTVVIFGEYLHYYLDSEIFRFADPAVRKHIGPLLT